MALAIDNMDRHIVSASKGDKGDAALAIHLTRGDVPSFICVPASRQSTLVIRKSDWAYINIDIQIHKTSCCK